MFLSATNIIVIIFILVKLFHLYICFYVFLFTFTASKFYCSRCSRIDVSRVWLPLTVCTFPCASCCLLMPLNRFILSDRGFSQVGRKSKRADLCFFLTFGQESPKGGGDPMTPSCLFAISFAPEYYPLSITFVYFIVFPSFRCINKSMLIDWLIVVEFEVF